MVGTWPPPASGKIHAANVILSSGEPRETHVVMWNRVARGNFRSLLRDESASPVRGRGSYLALSNARWVSSPDAREEITSIYGVNPVMSK